MSEKLRELLSKIPAPIHYGERYSSGGDVSQAFYDGVENGRRRLAAEIREAQTQTIYAVSRGSFSDYTIHAVFDAENLAKDFAGSEDESDFIIETWNLNETGGYKVQQVWDVDICLESGEVKGDINCYQNLFPVNGQCGVEFFGWGSAKLALLRVRSSVSAEHVLKVATEKRQEYLRFRSQGVSVDKIRELLTNLT